MMIELTAADGHRLECWMVDAKSARKGGIVILQEIFGVTDQLKDVADRYAALGYDVAIPALFDRHQKGAVIPFDEAPRGRSLMLSSSLDQTMIDVDAAVEALKSKGGRVAIIGYCWGGGLAIRAAQVLDIACAVSFYGTRLDAYQIAPLKAPVQGHWGSEDAHVPPEMLNAARTFFPDMEVHTYAGADHAFANEHRPAAYLEEAAKLAHARAAAFIAAHV